jgi:glycosyltransferase involved in cell wall biosynthesis
VVRRDGDTDEEVIRELDVRHRLIAEELRQADRVLVPSEAQKAFLTLLLPGEGARLQVLPHGTITRLSPCVPSDSATGPLRVAYWGPLAWWKGPHLLLEALHRLPGPSRVEGHLFGSPADADYERQLEELARGLAIVFHGRFIPADLHREGLHLGVFPSLCHESHSFVVDEALQLGVPLIVPDRGAPAQRIGTAGLTFKTGDAEDLSRQIRRVLEEPVLLERLRRGKPAAPLVPLEVHVAQLEEVYRQVIATGEVAQCTVGGQW